MMEILPLRLEFCDNVAEIARECLPEHWSAAEFENTLQYEHNLYYVACDGRKEAEQENGEGSFGAYDIVGFAGIMMVAEEAELLNIAVVPEYRKQGVGAMLLQRLLCEAEERGMSRMLLEVRESNRVARDFYVHHGFRELDIRKGYYSNPKENAVIMECSIIKRENRC